ncbi:MAG: transposase [Elusimicrobiota bacterium]|nr:transposase [Elusimicrobiota bacterium]
MPLCYFHGAPNLKKEKSDDQILTLNMPLMALTASKETALLKMQSEFTRCAAYFLNEACERKTTSAFKLHKFCYKQAREQFSLSSATIQTARDRAIAIQRIFWARVRKWKKTTQPEIKHDIPIHLRQDAYSLFKKSDTWYIKFALKEGRQSYICLPLITRAYILNYLTEEFSRGSAEIYKNKNKWILSLSIKIPYAPKDFDKTIGIDLGIRHRAVLSNNIFFTGKPLRKIRYRQFKRRFRSKKLKYLEHLQITHLNHILSKQIVQMAKTETANLALEYLTGIKERLLYTTGLSQSVISHWSYKQLSDFICYKAKLAGLSVKFVDPADTSITCSRCGFKSKDNRKSQSEFKCGSCGFELNADLNASRNIAEKKGLDLELIEN